MGQIATVIFTIIKGFIAAKELFEQVQELYVKDQLAHIDADQAERKKDIEYIIALKRKALENKNEEEIDRTHRIFIRLFNRV